MSEPKLISPLLDGFVIGNPMSNHDGVQCLPAMKENSEEKYIVKIISIPASQVQLEALLLTGAYKDPADAMDYFKETADKVIQEAESLQKLSKLEGFLSYEGWQIAPMENGLGYQVYLLGTYKRSLEKYMRRNQLTHLEAINLSLDLCAALAIARRDGLLYIDLKPGNIFISKNKEYRIGDLGFAALDMLKYTSLPAKYRSPYSPPELQDAMNTLNETADTYAVGMVLYQIYNDGKLPFIPEDPKEAIPSPANADYELAEIIMKAISSNPESRWKNPMEMGQALVAYMQRNAVNNIPITPPIAVITPESAEKESPAENEQAEETAPDVQQEPADITDEISSAIEKSENPLSDIEPTDVKISLPVEEPYIAADENEENFLHENGEVQQDTQESESEELIAEETPHEIPYQPESEPESEEAGDFDDLDDLDDLLSDAKAITASKVAVEDKPQPAKEIPVKEHRKVGKGLIAAVVTIMILAILGCGAFLVYQNYYLQTIDSLTVEGHQNELTVQVETQIDPLLLSVVCSDSYGNKTTKPLVDGQAVFTDLQPDSLYKIELHIEGMHKLIGKTSEIFTTEAMTKVIDISYITGAEDGAVMLNFTVDGPEPAEWVVTYTAEGEESLSQTFTGHDVNLKGLTVGKTYTVTLGAADGSAVLGQNTMEFVPSGLILAEDLTIVSCNAGNMTVRWSAPEGSDVASWTVRCYNDEGYEEYLEDVTQTEVVFSNIDTTAAYTVEVTADGMTQPKRTSITKNPITVTNLRIDESDPSKLTLYWTYDGAAPEGGWHLMYQMDSAETSSVVQCKDATAVISPRVHGANYKFTIQAANGTSIFSNIHSYECPDAAEFEANGLKAKEITAQTLVTPENADWSYYDISQNDITDQFTSGEKISILLHGSVNFYIPSEKVEVLYVIRDQSGNVVKDLISHDSIDWKELWVADDYHYGELNLPIAPIEAGTYSLDIYFNNKALTTVTFTVKE